MTTQRWIGLAMLLLAVAFGVGLQICLGKLFHVETTSIRGPQEPVSTGDMTIQVIEERTVQISPNWPVAVPLVLFAGVGLVLILVGAPPRP